MNPLVALAQSDLDYWVQQRMNLRYTNALAVTIVIVLVVLGIANIYRACDLHWTDPDRETKMAAGVLLLVAALVVGIVCYLLAKEARQVVGPWP